MTTEPRRTRPGGRTQRTGEAVLAATREILTSSGSDALSIEAVAKASGVHRSTIHRRWRTVPGLVADLAAHVDAEFIPPDTGTLQGDLLAAADQLRRQLDGDGARLAAALIGWENPAVREVLDRFWTARQQNIAVLLELHCVHVPPATVTRLIAGPIYYQALMEGVTPSPADVEQLVELVMPVLRDRR